MDGSGSTTRKPGATQLGRPRVAASVASACGTAIPDPAIIRPGLAASRASMIGEQAGKTSAGHLRRAAASSGGEPRVFVGAFKRRIDPHEAASRLRRHSAHDRAAVRIVFSIRRYPCDR
jgi:hypothetical protein